MPDREIAFERRGGEWIGDGKPAQAHVIECKKGSGKHKLKFRVEGPPGRYVFDETDPIWVKADDGQCPDTHCSHPELRVKECGPTMLIVENMNEVAGKLRYQLNVRDQQDNSLQPIDPIIDNGGRGIA